MSAPVNVRVGATTSNQSTGRNSVVRYSSSKYRRYGRRYSRQMQRRIARSYLPMPYWRWTQEGKAEMHYTNTEWAAPTDIVDTGSSFLLNGIGVGAQVFNRLGRQVLMKSLILNVAITQQNGAVNGQTCRYMLVYDRQANTGAQVNAQILDNSTAVPWTQKVKNLDNSQRFLILRDRTFIVKPNLVDEGQYQLNDYIKLNLPVQFNAGNTATIGDIQTGSLYLWFFDQAPLGLINLRFQGAARLHFHDK